MAETSTMSTFWQIWQSHPMISWQHYHTIVERHSELQCKQDNVNHDGIVFFRKSIISLFAACSVQQRGNNAEATFLQLNIGPRVKRHNQFPRDLLIFAIWFAIFDEKITISEPQNGFFNFWIFIKFLWIWRPQSQMATVAWSEESNLWLRTPKS